MLESGDWEESIISANEYDDESWNPVQSTLTKDSMTSRMTPENVRLHFLYFFEGEL